MAFFSAVIASRCATLRAVLGLMRAVTAFREDDTVSDGFTRGKWMVSPTNVGSVSISRSNFRPHDNATKNDDSCATQVESRAQHHPNSFELSRHDFCLGKCIEGAEGDH